MLTLPIELEALLRQQQQSDALHRQIMESYAQPPQPAMPFAIPGDQLPQQPQAMQMPHPNMAQAPGYNPVAPPQPDMTTLVRPWYESAGVQQAGGLPSGNLSVRAPTSELDAIRALLEQAAIGGSAPGMEAAGITKTTSDRTLPEGTTQIQAGGSKLGISDPAKYAEWKANLDANEQAGRNLVAMRGKMRGEAKNMQRRGMDPRLAAIMAQLGGQGGEAGGMQEMLLAEAMFGKGAGMDMMRERRLAEQAKQGLKIGEMGVQAELAKAGVHVPGFEMRADIAADKKKKEDEETKVKKKRQGSGRPFNYGFLDILERLLSEAGRPDSGGSMTPEQKVQYGIPVTDHNQDAGQYLTPEELEAMGIPRNAVVPRR